MRFVVLGSGTGLPDADRGPAGFAVRRGDDAWRVDGGAGTLQRSAAAGIDPLALRGCVYSHRHPDHTGGLAPLLFARTIAQSSTSLPIWAGEGFADFLAAQREAWGHWLRAEATVTELSLSEPDVADLGGVMLHTRPAPHGGGALHLAFETDGRRVVFSGDTGPSEALADLARGADLLVCECGFAVDDAVGDHLRPQDVAAIVDAARPSAVWLTHLYPHVDAEEALATVAATGVAVRRAADGDVWDGRATPTVSARGAR